jgi:hypothetical protein
VVRHNHGMGLRVAIRRLQFIAVPARVVSREDVVEAPEDQPPDARQLDILLAAYAAERADDSSMGSWMVGLLSAEFGLLGAVGFALIHARDLPGWRLQYCQSYLFRFSLSERWSPASDRPVVTTLT